MVSGQRTELVDDATGFARLQERMGAANAQGSQRVLAFFSSVLGGITLNSALFTIGIDDHLVHRAHACFDTCNVVNSAVYGLDFHLDRFIVSSGKAKIDLSRCQFMRERNGGKDVVDPKTQKQILSEIILDLVAASQARNAFVRFWVSAGRGDFRVDLSQCKEGANFFAVVHEQKVMNPIPPVRDCFVSIPPKSKFLATMKSTNYLINALAAMEAAERTGSPLSMGIQVGPDGFVTEFAIGCLAIVTKEGALCTPTQDRILKSTTLERAMSLARQYLLPRGIIRQVAFRNLTPKDVISAKEVLRLGAGFVAPVIEIDNQTIGDGRPGPVALELHKLMIGEQSAGTLVKRPNYSAYKQIVASKI